jgi:HD-GYP domain-containing protein (c-di-GMP phosphodiesterase class II)
MYPPASIQQQCDDLTQLLGSESLPICFSATSGFAGGASEHQFAELGLDTAAAIAIVERCRRHKKFQLSDSSGDSTLFVIPLVHPEDENWFAVGVMRDLPRNAVERLVSTSFAASRRQVLIESQDQILLDAESELFRSNSERQWLRQLNFQRIDRKRGAHLPKQALETLRNIIDAEAIAISLYQDTDTERHGLESTISGKPNWSIDDIRLLLQRVSKPSLGDTVILNSRESTLPLAQLKSCIIVPLGVPEPIGFIVALNRRRHPGGVTSQTAPEFNYRDGQLLHDAAGYLLVDGHSNVLFQESEKLVLGMLRTMSHAIEARDPYTFGHSERVGRVAYEIAARLQLSEVACQEIYVAGVLHDIGKIGIPDQVLLKAGKLDADELRIIQQHPEIGHKILEEFDKLKFALPGVLYHHERVDGAGYPHRLKGDHIPLMARILAVSDAYDAMTSSRVYRNAMGQERAIEILQNGIGTQWDEKAVRACVDYISDTHMVLASGGADSAPTTGSQGEWLQLSHALRVLQL